MIPKMPFGRTGHNSTRTIFGAAAFGGVTQQEADATLEVLLQYGVNHIDTAASYGASEERIAPWMQQHRNTFFLATKTGERTYEKARAEIHRSLERLRVDQIDLLQLHNLVDEREWETALDSGGALEAALEARDEGLVRFIGVTGHGLAVARRHRMSLERFDFDSVLLPYSFVMMQNADYARDFQELQQICASETWRCKPSRRSRAVRGMGSSKRALRGINRWKTRTPSTPRRTGCWATSRCFSTRWAIFMCCHEYSMRPSRFEQAPDESRMSALLQEQEMAPLFVP
jgi:hypothetical protein